MTTINPYLTFQGNCEEAFNFYQTVFGGEFNYLGRFSDMPPSEDYPIPSDYQNKILHIGLPIGGETILMGSDTFPGSPLNIGDNISININVQSKEDADRIFHGLSTGGTISMPLDNTFWGAYFGSLKDQFGINWMVNFENQEQ